MPEKDGLVDLQKKHAIGCRPTLSLFRTTMPIMTADAKLWSHHRQMGS